MRERELEAPEHLDPCTKCDGDGVLSDGETGGRAWYVVCGSCFASTAPTAGKTAAAMRWNRGEVL